MSIIGCDLHTRYQVVAWVDEGRGGIQVRRLEHEGEEVRKSYVWWARGRVVRIEATFPALWFDRLLVSAGTNSGWGTRRAFGPAKFGSRRRTRAMPNCCWICCVRGGFRASGCRRSRSVICASRWCIG
jgi:hypothetical protein